MSQNSSGVSSYDSRAAVSASQAVRRPVRVAAFEPQPSRRLHRSPESCPLAEVTVPLLTSRIEHPGELPGHVGAPDEAGAVGVQGVSRGSDRPGGQTEFQAIFLQEVRPSSKLFWMIPAHSTAPQVAPIAHEPLARLPVTHPALHSKLPFGKKGFRIIEEKRRP
jgi:hypothetical protein